MRVLMLMVIALAAAGMIASASYAADAKSGEALFKDPNFAGGNKACNFCHPGGKGVEAAGSKSSFSVMGKKQDSLEDVVNFCIVNASGGKAIKKDSGDMKDIVAYIKSLGGKKASPGYGAPGYGAPGYKK